MPMLLVIHILHILLKMGGHASQDNGCKQISLKT